MVEQFISILWVKLIGSFIILLIFSMFWTVYIINLDWRKLPEKKRLQTIQTSLFTTSWFIVIILTILLVIFYGNGGKAIIYLIIGVWGTGSFLMVGVFNIFFRKKINNSVSLQFWKMMLGFWILSFVSLLAFYLKWHN